MTSKMILMTLEADKRSRSLLGYYQIHPKVQMESKKALLLLEVSLIMEDLISKVTLLLRGDP